MPSYLIQASYTIEALAALVKKPQDRTEMIRKSIENLGGELVGFWLSFGEQDVVSIIDLPNNVAAAAFRIAIASGGALKSVTITPLFTVAQGISALKKAATSGYTSVTAK
jgi:uncharacterized protein with GYD domain